MIKNTDKMVGKRVYMSLSAIYTHGKKADAVKQIIQKTLPEFRKLLDLPADLIFRVAPIKARNTNGSYDSDHKLVNIDCRLPWAKALEVLAHELVHAEQYHTNKLKKKFIGRKGWMHYWNGEIGKKGTTYKAYRDQPWEQEAWSRQAALAEQVCSILEEKYP
jgi:hypothetical protein